MTGTDAEGARERVRRAISAAGASPRLIGFEAIEIQRFVMASSRPIAIHGASQLIKEFDRRNLRESGAIFAGGGRGLMVVPEAEAQQVMRKLKGEFERATGGAPLSVVDAPLDPARQEDALRLLWLKQMSARDACEPDRTDLEFDGAPCADCRARPAAVLSPKPGAGQDERICARCDALIKSGREAGREAIQQRWTLNDLAEPRSLIATVCADGNNLGLLFRSLHDLAALAVVSDAVAAIFERAHAAALKSAGDPRRVDIVAGGDDIKVFMPATSALDYVSALINEVEHRASAVGDLGKALSPASMRLLQELGVGAGFVVARAFYPAARLIERGKDLERRAKACSVKTKARSAVDFAILLSDDEIAQEPLSEPSPARAEGAPETPRGVCPVRGADWPQVRRRAQILSKVPGSQRAIVSDIWRRRRAPQQGSTEAEALNLFRYQIARSAPWKAFFRESGLDWTKPDVVRENLPDPAMLSLARLIEMSGPEGKRS